jgi:hypothetical protein
VIREDYDPELHTAPILKARKLMKYGQAQFEKDWEEVCALAVLMAEKETRWRRKLFEAAWVRIHAYLLNNPDARPFKV